MERKNNQIQFTRFNKDTIISVEVNRIDDYKTRTSAYEGHYLHYNTQVKKSTENIKFKKGDFSFNLFF